MVFTHHARKLPDPKSGWWAVTYTDFAVNTAAFLLFNVYHSFVLWCLSTEMVLNIRQLDLVRVLGLLSNANKVECLLCVVECTNFVTLPDDWYRCGEVRCLAPGGLGLGADYSFIIRIAIVRVSRIILGMSFMDHANVFLPFSQSVETLRRRRRMGMSS